MNKEDYDELYHCLRHSSNSCTQEEQSTIRGLVNHLLAGGDYLSLIQYSAMYGEKFLVQPVFDIMISRNIIPKRIVEFGAGLGWLSRGLALKYGISNTLTIDKRPWAGINICADLETQKGRSDVLIQMNPGDIIVMSDFLHCVSNPEEIIEDFSHWPIVAIEYSTANVRYNQSYMEQIGRYGAFPRNEQELLKLFPAKTYYHYLFHYLVIVYIPERGENIWVNL